MPDGGKDDAYIQRDHAKVKEILRRAAKYREVQVV